MLLLCRLVHLNFFAGDVTTLKACPPEFYCAGDVTTCERLVHLNFCYAGVVTTLKGCPPEFCVCW